MGRSLFRVSPWVLALLAGLFAGLVTLGVASAQFTGGSVGGGDWGGSHGGGSSHSSGHGGSSSHGGDGFALVELVFMLFRVHPLLGAAALMGLLLYLIARSRSERTPLDTRSVGSAVPGPTSRSWFQVDITEVRVALDARARSYLQRELMDQGRRADTRTKQGLVSLLHVVVDALQKSDAAWVYAGAKNFHPTSSVLAQAAFTRLAGEARAKFTHELLRKDASGVAREGEGHGVTRSREREGEGVVLVTILAAASREIIDFQASSRVEVHKVLDDLRVLTPANLVALEISWLPADGDDLMSTATLEALHPDMQKLPGAVGGRVFCAYCQGPYTAELRSCPHCGAPSPSASTPA